MMINLRFECPKIPLHSFPIEQVAELVLKKGIATPRQLATILDRSLIDSGGFLEITALPCTDFL